MLKNENEAIIFSISYDKSWYKDISKSEGGWALEMIDTGNPCGDGHNWSASEHSSGGTPGKQNSVSQPNPDNLGPKLLKAAAIDNITVLLTFNEKINHAFLDQIEILLEPEVAVVGKQLNRELTQLSLTLAQPLVARQPYQLTVITAKDCLGNAIDEAENQAVIWLPESAEAGDLVINEILFNPKSGGEEFIEIFNTSDKNILLDQIGLATNTKYENILVSPIVISPGDYLVFTGNAANLKSSFPNAPAEKLLSVNNLPALHNDESSLNFYINNLLLDSIYYHSSFHFPLIKDEKGVSLERIFSDRPALDENNWQSAVAQVGFATPGRINSQSRPEVVMAGSLAAEPATFAPGDPGGRSFTSINYQMESPGKLATITIHDLTGRTIRTIVQNQTLAASGSFIWDGITDQGQQVRMGAYLIVMEVYDLQGQLQIFKERVAVGRNF